MSTVDRAELVDEQEGFSVKVIIEVEYTQGAYNTKRKAQASIRRLLTRAINAYSTEGKGV